jgi:hypothetical protein
VPLTGVGVQVPLRTHTASRVSAGQRPGTLHLPPPQALSDTSVIRGWLVAALARAARASPAAGSSTVHDALRPTTTRTGPAPAGGVDQLAGLHLPRLRRPRLSKGWCAGHYSQHGRAGPWRRCGRSTPGVAAPFTGATAGTTPGACAGGTSAGPTPTARRRGTHRPPCRTGVRQPRPRVRHQPGPPGGDRPRPQHRQSPRSHLQRLQHRHRPLRRRPGPPGPRRGVAAPRPAVAGAGPRLPR